MLNNLDNDGLRKYLKRPFMKVAFLKMKNLISKFSLHIVTIIHRGGWLHFESLLYIFCVFLFCSFTLYQDNASKTIVCGKSGTSQCSTSPVESRGLLRITAVSGEITSEGDHPIIIR